MRYLHPQKTNASTINLRPRKKICVAQVTQPGIFFGCLRGRYKAPVPMANAYIFSQFEQKNSQSEGHFFVNQYSLQIAFIFNGLLIKIKHMIRNKSDSMQFKRSCLRKYYKK